MTTSPLLPSTATSQDVAYMERTIAQLSTANRNLEITAALLTQERDALRGQCRTLQEERDAEMARANKLMTICEATSLHLVQGLKQMSEERRDQLKQRRAAQELAMSAESDPPPLMKTSRSGSTFDDRRLEAGTAGLAGIAAVLGVENASDAFDAGKPSVQPSAAQNALTSVSVGSRPSLFPDRAEPIQDSRLPPVNISGADRPVDMSPAAQAMREIKDDEDTPALPADLTEGMSDGNGQRA